MSTLVHTTYTSERIRVAVVFAAGKIKPVWFELADKQSRERIFIKQVCYIWLHMEGKAKVINFAVYDGANSYTLSLNTDEFTWSLGIIETEPYPSYHVDWNYRS